MSRTSRAMGAGLLCALPLLCDVPSARAQVATLTASASVTSAGGVSARAPVTVTIDRFATDAERDELVAAVREGGTTSARALLATRADIGSVQLGGRRTPIKYAYSRSTGGGTLVTVITKEPIVFIGAGVPNAPPTTDDRLGLVLLEASASGPGQGELIPAARVRVGEHGGFVTEDYSRETVRLSDVVRK